MRDEAGTGGAQPVQPRERRVAVALAALRDFERVSERCVWIGRSSWRAYMTILSHVASPTVYGACGASEKASSGACL